MSGEPTMLDAGPESGVVGLLSVNIGLPAELGRQRGEPVLSGIRKHPVDADYLFLDRLNLAGDGQADLTVHGGPEKAVYAYASEHFVWWDEELGRGPSLSGRPSSVRT